VLWLSGVVALASFFFCLGLAIWVFVRGADGYTERLVQFKTWLLWGSLIHLATAAIWIRENEKGKNGNHA
jgi:hypothetical protein